VPSARKERFKSRIEVAVMEAAQVGAVAEVGYAFVGPGLWPFLGSAAVLVALFGIIELRSGVDFGIWDAVIYGVAFGAAYLVWMISARPHFLGLTSDRLFLIPSAWWSVRPAGPVRSLALAGLRGGTFKPGWAWGRLDVLGDEGGTIRLNFPRGWAPEMARLRDALGRPRGRPPET
jgi:hypothetical protein